jgi:hypothetical protein
VLSQKTNLSERHLFEAPDNYAESAMLRSLFEDESRDVQAALDDTGARDIAHSLRFWLHNTREPLCTSIFTSCLVDADVIDDKVERLDCICSIVKLLPPQNFTLLRALVSYLKLYVKQRGELEQVLDKFAPLLIWEANGDDEEAARDDPTLKADVNGPDSLVVIGANSALELAAVCVISLDWTAAQVVSSLMWSQLPFQCRLTKARWRLWLPAG